jgi:hypothetical protein
MRLTKAIITAITKVKQEEKVNNVLTLDFQAALNKAVGLSWSDFNTIRKIEDSMLEGRILQYYKGFYGFYNSNNQYATLVFDGVVYVPFNISTNTIRSVCGSFITKEVVKDWATVLSAFTNVEAAIAVYPELKPRFVALFGEVF